MSKVVLVTGGSRGIGRQVAIQLAKEGYRLLINYNKSQKEAQETCRFLREEGYQVEIFKADVSKQDQVKAMFDFCMDRFGSIDVLVNNSGISYEGLITDMDEEDWDRIIDTNLKSVFLCSKEALKHMISNHSGKIINISSMWGQVGASCEVAYSASKAGMIALAKSVAQEMGPKGVRANAIAPGFIDTAMTQQLSEEIRKEWTSKIPLRRGGTTEDIANTALYLASDLSSYVSGQVIQVDGGMNM